MRTNFVNALLNIARQRKDIHLITGDLGFMALEPFRDELPGQYLNAGISEQNLTGMAAGMALSGKTVFIYSIIPFITMRNFEHIRNDIAMHNLDVKIVGVGAGFSYSVMGSTHHAKEDIAIMRALPNMKIVAPADPWEVREAVKAIVDIPGPVYLRLGRNGELQFHKEGEKLVFGKGMIMAEGKDISLIAAGNTLDLAIEVHKILEEKGHSVRLISMHTIKPLDTGLILDLAARTKAIFTIEEHSIFGGLGSAVAEVLAEGDSKTIFKRFAIPDEFMKVVGSQKYLREICGLSPEKIAGEISSIMSRKKVYVNQ